MDAETASVQVMVRSIARSTDAQILATADVELDISSDLRGSWFRPATSLDAYGREQPSFDLTRDGF
jgi:hypothetical protein